MTKLCICYLSGLVKLKLDFQLALPAGTLQSWLAQANCPLKKKIQTKKKLQCKMV